jgi:RNA polymerase sigma factor (sigma-70 family)
MRSNSSRQTQTGLTDLVSKEDLAAARRIFRGRLRRKGFPLNFFEEFGEDLLAQAHLDLLTIFERGTDIYEPRGLLVHCAWRRTQHLVGTRSRQPAFVSAETAAPPPCERPTPEEAFLTTELAGRMSKAMNCLAPPERAIIELIYLQGMSCRAAALKLGWGRSTAHRKHHAALGRLRPFFEKDAGA